MTGSQFVVAAVGSLGSCLGMLILLYNVLSVALFLRESTEGRASGIAKACWAAGVFALFLWWMPCVGSVLALIAIVLGRVERGRIYRDASPLAGITPIRLGHLDGVLVLGLQVLTFTAIAVGTIANQLE